MTTIKKIAKFEEWFGELESGNQLRTLACLMRLKKVKPSESSYDKEIKKCIFRLERKRGNSELLKFFTGIGIEEDEFKGLVFKFFDLGRKIRGHVERPKKIRRAGIIGGAIAGAGIGIFTERRRSNFLRKKIEGGV